jgi:HEAT repeat protein
LVSLAAALLAVLSYFTRKPSRKAWNEPLSHWIVALRSPSASSRDSALGAIEYLGPLGAAMVPLLSPVLEDSDGAIRVRASAILIELGQAGEGRASVRQSMVPLLANGRTGPARAQAALVLGKTQSDEITTAALMEAMNDPESEVRAAAAFALGEVATQPHPNAMSALIKASRDPAAEVRAAAMESLRRFWPEHDSVLRVAGTALGDTASIVREQAIHALAGFGNRARRYRSSIVEVASHDSDPGIRNAANRALGQVPFVP